MLFVCVSPTTHFAAHGHVKRTPLRVLSCIETLVGHVMYLKELMAAAFVSSEWLRLLRLNGRVRAHPT